MSHLLALDQGTTSSRALVFNCESEILAVAQREFEQHFPEPGWVEHDPLEIWTSQAGVMTEALTRSGLSPRDIAAVGITNQRETVIVWDRKTGQPVYPAIVWQDRRTAKRCDELKRDGATSTIRAKTGLVVDSYFSATKVEWILDQVPGTRARAEAGELAFGTVDSWLAFKLTGGELHVTDVSNASRTMLYNIHNGGWDEELLELFHIPRELLPEVKPSSEVYGEVVAEVGARGVPLASLVGDQQGALMGQLCTEPGLAKNTYGTGCFLLMNTGSEAQTSKNQLLSTLAWQIGDQSTYALEGSAFVGGAVVQWLRDGLEIIRHAREMEPLAASVPDSGGVVLVPALAGLGAPHWDPYARGTLLGLTRGTTKAHIARAALEGIAFEVNDLVQAMERDAGTPVQELRVDGGAAANNLLLQFQADLLQRPVVRPKTLETTALGAAYLAGLATGVWKSTSDLKESRKIERIFRPERSEAEATQLAGRYREAVERAKGWAQLG